MRDSKMIVHIRPKRWWSIRAWRRAKALQSLDNWLILTLLEQYSLTELLSLDWQGLEKAIEDHIIEREQS